MLTADGRRLVYCGVNRFLDAPKIEHLGYYREIIVGKILFQKVIDTNSIFYIYFPALIPSQNFFPTLKNRRVKHSRRKNGGQQPWLELLTDH